MRPLIVLLLLPYFLGGVSATSAQTGNGTPFKYISSCEIDLNADSVSDIAVLIESMKGRELIVLLRTKEGYEAHIVSSDVPESMYLRCEFGTTIEGTVEGKDSTEVVTIPGTYLELYEPEGSSIGYYWDGKEFKEIWLSD